MLDETVTPALVGAGDASSAPTARPAEVPVAAIAASLTFTPQDDGTLAVGIDPAALQTAMGDELEGLRQRREGRPVRGVRRHGHRRPVGRRRRGRPGAPGRAAAAGARPSRRPRTVTAELGPGAGRLHHRGGAGPRHQGGDQQLHDQLRQRRTAATNIRVVAAEVDGALVMPGETFSLNSFTGPRGTAQGYVPAGVISGGKFTTGGRRRDQPVRHDDVQRGLLLRPRGRPPQAAQLLHQPLPGRPRGDGLRGLRSTCSGRTTATPASTSTPRGRPARSPSPSTGTKRYEIESISSNRTNVREPAVQEKPDDGDLQPAGRRPGLRHHRHPGLQGPGLRRGDQAGELQHPLRRRADHPLRRRPAGAGARGRRRRPRRPADAPAGRRAAGGAPRR